MKSLSYLNKYFLKYKWRLLLGILFITGSNLFKVKMPKYFGDQIDNFKTNASEFSGDDILGTVLYIGFIYMLLSIASGFFLFLTRQTIIIMSRLIEFDLKNEVYSQYQCLDYSFFKKNSTGDLMNRISEDVSRVRMYLGPGVMYSINLIVLSILCISQMVMINGYLTILVLLPLPIMSFLIYKVSSRMSQISTVVQEEQSKMSTLAQEYFSGIRVVKAYSRNSEVERKFTSSAEAYKTKNMRLVLVNSLFMPTIFLLIGLSTVLCIYIGGVLFFDIKITEGNIISFVFFVNLLTWPFASIGWVTSIIQRAGASQKRINEFLEVKPDIYNTNKEPFDFKGEVEFKNVSYTYPNSGLESIRNVSFRFKAGESLGITGKTGSGKSTILKLLMRQIDPDQGNILIDGKDLKVINLELFRDQTGVVPQEVFLFSETIRNNILFGTKEKDVNDDKLVEVTKKAHVHHNIVDFPGGFDTLLGERGVNLSGGQKQRLSIARALIRNPKLLLLDDCLSAVDTETEEAILRNLKNSDIESSLIVSHRLSSIRNANKIIVLDQGQIIEQGTHSELMQMNGQYAEMHKKQLAEEELD